jgi:hypothetical protein
MAKLNREQEHIAQIVAQGLECKHGMKWEWCGLCQRVTWFEDVTVYPERKDEDGNVIGRFRMTVHAKRETYKRYR